MSACDLRSQVDNPEVAELRECLEKYTAPEVVQLEGWRCPNCRNQPSQAYKNFAFRSLPDVLIIHLKRFKLLSNGEYLKLHPLINFPTQGLDMSPYLVASGGGGGPPKKPTRGLKLNGLSPKLPQKQQLFIRTDLNHNIYDLYGVCNHLGESIHSGHYTGTQYTTHITQILGKYSYNKQHRVASQTLPSAK